MNELFCQSCGMPLETDEVMKELFKNAPNFNEQNALDNMKLFFPKLKRWM